MFDGNIELSQPRPAPDRTRVHIIRPAAAGYPGRAWRDQRGHATCRADDPPRGHAAAASSHAMRAAGRACVTRERIHRAPDLALSGAHISSWRASQSGGRHASLYVLDVPALRDSSWRPVAEQRVGRPAAQVVAGLVRDDQRPDSRLASAGKLIGA
jgi:hypothetical protein